MLCQYEFLKNNKSDSRVQRISLSTQQNNTTEPQTEGTRQVQERGSKATSLKWYLLFTYIVYLQT